MIYNGNESRKWLFYMYWVARMSDMVYRKWLFYMYMYWVPGMSDKNWFLRVEGQSDYRRIVFFFRTLLGLACLFFNTDNIVFVFYILR